MVGTVVPEMSIRMASVVLLRAYAGTGTAYEKHAARSARSASVQPIVRHFRAQWRLSRQKNGIEFGGDAERSVDRMRCGDKTGCGVAVASRDGSAIWRFALKRTLKESIRNAVRDVV